MEKVVVSLIVLVFLAYVGFHILILSRLIARGAAPIVIVYAVLRLLTLPLVAAGALLSIFYPETQTGRVGVVLLMCGAAAMVARLVIGGIWTARRRERLR